MFALFRGTPVGVLVVDDQLVFRQAAREVIEATSNFELLGEAASGEQALALLHELYPDLVLVDIRMPEMDGVAAAARIHGLLPQAGIVLITDEEAPNGPRGVSSCGAATLVRKQDFGPSLLRRVWKTYGD